VVLIPSSSWDKTGLTGINLKLGCTIRYETVQKALGKKKIKNKTRMCLARC
jgi:hypothetical protein